MARIVVGVEGSPHAQQALRWAINEGRLRGASVVAAHAWHLPYDGTRHYVTLAFDPEHFERQARHVLEAAVAAEDCTDLVAPVEQVLVHGSAAAGLLALAAEAELLVVGARGLGGFKGLLLGSVSTQVIHHSTCPVVVVRGARDDGGQE